MVLKLDILWVPSLVTVVSLLNLPLCCGTATWSCRSLNRGSWPCSVGLATWYLNMATLMLAACGVCSSYKKVAHAHYSKVGRWRYQSPDKSLSNFANAPAKLFFAHGVRRSLACVQELNWEKWTVYVYVSMQLHIVLFYVCILFPECVLFTA